MRIPLSAPELSGNERRYVEECLASGWVSSAGAFVERFEGLAAAAVGRRYGVAVMNGTSALHLALLVAGVAAGDEVVTSALSFVAPANAIRYVGARPLFVDAEPESWQLDVARLEEHIEQHFERREGGWFRRTSGRRLAALLPVDILGMAADWQRLTSLAARYELPLIEDASESLGAWDRGAPVGSFGLCACLSFNGNKLVTCGGGGMLVSDDEELARRARHLSTTAKVDPIEYRHDEVGYNYRLTNLQAALGCAQIERLEELVARKRAIATRYRAALADLPGLESMPQRDGVESSCWLFTITVDVDAFGCDSRALLRALARAGIESRPLWQPLHASDAHRDSDSVGGSVAADLYARALCLPSSVGLTTAEQDEVIDAIRQTHERCGVTRR